MSGFCDFIVFSQHISRREFLRVARDVSAAGLAVVPIGALGPIRRDGARQRRPQVQLGVDTLTPFVDPLVVPPVARPASVRAMPHAGTPVYQLSMRVVERRVHRDVPPTRFWSFGDSFPGPTIDVRRGAGCWVDWINALPPHHFLPIDRHVHGADASVPDNRAVVHVHGARVKPEYDGYPEHWVRAGETASYFYPNDQDAATLWYHDHTMGLNRLHVYAGLLGAYFIRDDVETGLDLPSGPHELPLVLCDRMFDTAGQLIYPDSGDPNAPWVPEVFGDGLLVNGGLFPFARVEPAAYRLRVVNACNSRYLHLSLMGPHGPVPMLQIGSDQGLLDRAAPLDRLDILPAERADLVVDFSRHAGARLHLMSDARAVVEWRVDTTQPRPFTLPATLRTIERLQPTDAMPARTHVLAEEADKYKQPMRMLLNDARWHDPVTETPRLGSTEVWSLVNTTDDAHPIHLHLVRFQVLDRRPFDGFAYRSGRGLRFMGPAVPPDAGERGWKDTVRAEPGMVTRIIVRFDGYAGRYMWHCHLLEHGDNEMMRPMEILPAPGPDSRG